MDGPVTIREVYALLGQTKAEVLGALRDLKADEAAAHMEHERVHERELVKRRWVVMASVAMGGLVGGFINNIINILQR